MTADEVVKHLSFIFSCYQSFPPVDEWSSIHPCILLYYALYPSGWLPSSWLWEGR